MTDRTAAEVLRRALLGSAWDELTDAYTAEEQILALLAEAGGGPAVITASDEPVRQLVEYGYAENGDPTGLLPLRPLYRASMPATRLAPPEDTTDG